MKKPLKEPLTVLSSNQNDLHPPLLKSFPEILKEKRKEKKWSQEELAKKAGISTMQVSRLESAKHMPTISTIIRLAPYLSYPIDELLLSASYAGAVPASDPTYVDFKGKQIDPGELGKEMYRKDGELFLKTYEFYQSFSSENSEFLKCVLDQLKAENKQTTESITDKQIAFTEMFQHLKLAIISLGKAFENS